MLKNVKKPTRALKLLRGESVIIEVEHLTKVLRGSFRPWTPFQFWG